MWASRNASAFLYGKQNGFSKEVINRTLCCSPFLLRNSWQGSYQGSCRQVSKDRLRSGLVQVKATIWERDNNSRGLEWVLSQSHNTIYLVQQYFNLKSAFWLQHYAYIELYLGDAKNEDSRLTSATYCIIYAFHQANIQGNALLSCEKQRHQRAFMPCQHHTPACTCLDCSSWLT